MTSVSTSPLVAELRPGDVPAANSLRSQGSSALLAMLLAEQQNLSAVERFAQRHGATDRPSQAQYYRSLLPASPPGPGQQYAFEVDLDRCSGCKSCVTACHSLNGLDEHETWRDTGLLHGGTPELPVVQHVTTACHHCLDPACMSACPVRAYEKHPVTGIVKHLDDQCIGCQYCVFACPYDVPKYNPRLGIVRKCDLCSSRLAVGEAPACAQACPHEAIRITLADKQDVIDNCQTNVFLPGAPDATITFPTTNYKTARPLPRNLLPADYFTLKREHAHWPLIVMLVLTQLSVGAFLAEFIMRLARANDSFVAVRPIYAASTLAFGLIALSASVFHLGRPRYAFRAFLGLRTSWLSREIVAFGLFALTAAAYSLSTWLPAGGDAGAGRNALGLAVVVCGLSGVFCSIMVYAVTRRAYWNVVATSLKFLLTTIALGAATALATSLLAAEWFGTDDRSGVLTWGQPLCLVLIVSTAAKLVVEAAIFRHLRQKQASALRRSAILMTRDLAAVTKSRFVCGLVGGIALPGMLLDAAESTSEMSEAFVAVAGAALLVVSLAGELLERYLFFTAVAPPKMPGGVS